MPALPQQISCFGERQDLDAGDRPQQIARRLADALRVREVTGVVVRDAHRERMARRSRRAELGDDFGHVADARRERPRALRPRRIVGEQLSVFLHRRSASRRRSRRSAPRRRARTSRSCGARTRAPRRAGRRAARARRSSPASAGAITSQPSAASTRTVASFTLRKHDALHAAGQQPDRQARARRSAGVRSGIADDSDRHVTSGASASIARSARATTPTGRVVAKIAESPFVVRPAFSASPRFALIDGLQDRQRRERDAQAAGNGNSAKIAPRNRRSPSDAVAAARSARASLR